jgi:hypothetical protein
MSEIPLPNRPSFNKCKPSRRIRVWIVGACMYDSKTERDKEPETQHFDGEVLLGFESGMGKRTSGDEDQESRAPKRIRIRKDQSLDHIPISPIVGKVEGLRAFSVRAMTEITDRYFYHDTTAIRRRVMQPEHKQLPKLPQFHFYQLSLNLNQPPRASLGVVSNSPWGYASNNDRRNENFIGKESPMSMASPSAPASTHVDVDVPAILHLSPTLSPLHPLVPRVATLSISDHVSPPQSACDPYVPQAPVIQRRSHTSFHSTKYSLSCPISLEVPHSPRRATHFSFSLISLSLSLPLSHSQHDCERF